MGDKIAYTDKMLATIFRRKESTVQLALQTFEQFGMIELIDGVITIPNWGKHQSLEQLEARKKYQRDYQREYRKKQKLITSSEVQDESKHLHKHLHKDDVNSLDKIRIDKNRLEEDKNNILSDSDESAPAPKKPSKHKYGEYQNVLLTDEELDKLQAEYPDWEDRIERLSSYVASTGKKYKSHYATIRNWARKDTKPITYQKPVDNTTNQQLRAIQERQQKELESINLEELEEGVF